MEPTAALVVRAPLVAQAHERAPLVFGVRDDNAALPRRDLLVRIEAEDTGRPVRSERTAFVLGAERFRRVFDQPQPVLLRKSPQLVELTRIPEHVDRDDPPRALRD